MGQDGYDASDCTPQALLGGSGALPPVERELIAMHVSSAVCCVYCVAIHSAIAAYHLGGDNEMVLSVKDDYRKAPISERLKALLSIAGKVRGSRHSVTSNDIHRARRKGASDLEIHDTLLIASMFCMCNGEGWHKAAKRGGRPRTGLNGMNGQSMPATKRGNHQGARPRRGIDPP